MHVHVHPGNEGLCGSVSAQYRKASVGNAQQTLKKAVGTEEGDPQSDELLCTLTSAGATHTQICWFLHGQALRLPAAMPPGGF